MVEPPAHLVEQFRRGEPDAFLEVYRALAADVRRWVARFFRSPFEQEEAVQEIWLLAHRNGRGYDDRKGPFGPWLRALAHNRCKELLRAQGRRVQPDLELEALEAELPDAAPGPDAQARAMRVRDAVARFAATLDAEERRALELGLVEERTHEELAEALQINVRRSKYLKHKLLARAAADPGLRDALAELLG